MSNEKHNAAMRLSYKHAAGTAGHIFPLVSAHPWELHLKANELAAPILRRIVACVNACEGISTEALAPYYVRQEIAIYQAGIEAQSKRCDALKARAVEVTAQRDALLAALRMSRDCFRRMDRTARREEALRVIEAAIANAKGGA